MIKTLQKRVNRATKPAVDSFQKSMNETSPELKKKAKYFLLGALVLVIVISVFKYVRVKMEESARAAEIAAGPLVHVQAATQSPGNHTLQLIGETRPYAEATLYAKVSGYLKSVKVDKGDVVKEGQLLAVIESPETDQAYEGALADAKNKNAIKSRMSVLFDKHLISQQENDQAVADADVASSRLRAAETLKGYETIRAPFGGTVTARFADPGVLVQNATNSQTSSQPIVTVSTINRLRVDVFVDQHDAPYVAKDEPISITLSDRPGFKILGKVSRVSGELDPKTKMLLTEIDVPNDKQEMVAGSFVQVALDVKSPPFVQAPVEALLVKGEKSYVTTITTDNKIALKEVLVSNNDGKMLWIASGLNAGEVLALNVGDTISEGGKVRPIYPDKEGAGAAKKP